MRLFRVGSTWSLLVCRVDSVQRPKFRRYEVYKVQIWSNAFLNNGHRIRYSVFASKAANFPRTPLPYENFRLFSWSIKRFDRFKYFLQTKAPGSIFCLRMLCLRSSERKFWKISCRHWGASDFLIAGQVSPRVPLLDLNFVSPDSQRLLIHYLADFRVR